MNWKKLKINCTDISALMVGDPLAALTDAEQISYENLTRGGRKRPLSDLQKARKERLEKKIKDYSGVPKGASLTLIEKYCMHEFGIRKISIGDELAIAAMKGKRVEDQSGQILRELDGIDYKIHREPLENDYLIGKIDLYHGESIRKVSKVIEIKSSMTPVDFMKVFSRKKKGLSVNYYWQVMGYLALTGAESAEICYVMTETPTDLLEKEINFKLRKSKMRFDDPEFIEWAEYYRANNDFSHIPIQKRVFRFEVIRNELEIAKIYERIIAARKWCSTFAAEHNKAFKKPLIYAGKAPKEQVLPVQSNPDIGPENDAGGSDLLQDSQIEAEAFWLEEVAED